MILSPKSYSKWWQCWCFFWVMIVIVTLVGWPHYKRMLQPPPWFSPRHGFGSSHVCCAWHRAQGEASTSLNHHINFYQYSTFYLFFNICQKRCLVTGLSGCAWRRGEARPGARRPARTHTTGKVCLFLAFFCLFFYFFLFLVFRLFCLFSSAIVSFFQGARWEEGGGETGSCSLKKSCFL